MGHTTWGLTGAPVRMDGGAHGAVGVPESGSSFFYILGNSLFYYNPGMKRVRPVIFVFHCRRSLRLLLTFLE